MKVLKKVGLLCIALLFNFIHGTYSQSIGVKLGGTLGRMDKSLYPSTNYFGFVGGITSELPLHRFGKSSSYTLSLAPELLYTERPNFSALEFSQRFNYIELPALFRLKFNSENSFVYVNTGPVLAYGVRYYLNGPFYRGYSKGRRLSFSDAKLSPLDIAVQFGCGIGFKLGPGHFIFDVRRSLSLGTAYRPESLSTAGSPTFNTDLITKDGSYQSKYWAFTIGYSIPLKFENWSDK